MSLKEIYQQQLVMKELLQEMYLKERSKLHEMKFSFSEEIEEMIKEY